MCVIFIESRRKVCYNKLIYSVSYIAERPVIPMACFSSVSVMGVRIDNVTPGEAVAYLGRCLEDGQKGYVVTPNAEIVYLGRKDAETRAALNGSLLSVPDGVGVVKAARILGSPVKGKVAGVELGVNLLPELVRQGKSLYILGAKPGVAEKAAENLAARFPGLRIAGTHDGYFKSADEVIPLINESGADVCYVCLGAPKQEFWMRDNLPKTCCSLMLGIGGSADIYAGEARRAPEFFVKLGLEWFYRLLKEPRRIGRMMALPKFLLLAVGDRLTASK